MKKRPIVVLLLFVAATATLVWVYFASPDRPRRPKSPSWGDTIDDLTACCRRKHIKATQYDHFSAIAEREQRPDIARAFRAMAVSGRIQECICAETIVRLGGRYTPARRVSVFAGPTDDNLARSLAFELQSLQARRGTEIDHALHDGNRHAARMLIWASAGDRQHILLIERLLAPAPPARQSDGYYWICPTCGGLTSSRLPNYYCPHCQTDGRRFIRVE